MTEYLTEQEQIEQLKKWFRVYGLPAILGVVVGISLFYGWNYYQSNQTRILTHASRVYDEMLTDRAQNNAESTVVQAQKLLRNYPHTPYGQMAALMLAHEAIAKQDYEEALKQLNWVMDHSKQAALRQIARLRIARIYITQQKPEEAIQLLKTVDDKNFSGLMNEVLGDAELALNHTTEAQAAYQQALQELPNSEQIRPLLEMKLDNLVA